MTAPALPLAGLQAPPTGPAAGGRTRNTASEPGAFAREMEQAHAGPAESDPAQGADGRTATQEPAVQPSAVAGAGTPTSASARKATSKDPSAPGTARAPTEREAGDTAPGDPRGSGGQPVGADLSARGRLLRAVAQRVPHPVGPQVASATPKAGSAADVDPQQDATAGSRQLRTDSPDPSDLPATWQAPPMARMTQPGDSPGVQAQAEPAAAALGLAKAAPGQPDLTGSPADAARGRADSGVAPFVAGLVRDRERDGVTASNAVAIDKPAPGAQASKQPLASSEVPDRPAAAAVDVATSAVALALDPQAIPAVDKSLGNAESPTAPALPTFASALVQAGLAAAGGASQAPSRPATELSLPTPVLAPEFVPRLTGELAVLARDGVQEARIQVNPLELGPIAVQITLEGDRAQVHLATSSAPTRDVLEQAMPALAAALRENGLTLTGGGVFEQARQNPRDAEHPGTRGRSEASSSRGDGPADSAVSVAPRRTRHLGVIDTYA